MFGYKDIQFVPILFFSIRMPSYTVDFYSENLAIYHTKHKEWKALYIIYLLYEFIWTLELEFDGCWGISKIHNHKKLIHHGHSVKRTCPFRYGWIEIINSQIVI